VASGAGPEECVEKMQNEIAAPSRGVVEAMGKNREVEIGEGSLREGGAVERPGEEDRGGQVVRRIARIELLEKNRLIHINRKHLDIRGCWGSEARHFLRALAIHEPSGPD
jgi:hypothetical protein